MKKIALIIGHKPSQQGAVSYNNVTEYEFNTQIAKLVKLNPSDLLK